MTDSSKEPQMPEPYWVLTVSGPFQDWRPTVKAFDLPDGEHPLITTAAALAYAEALAAHRVAQELERLTAERDALVRQNLALCDAMGYSDRRHELDSPEEHAARLLVAAQPPADIRLLMQAFEAVHQRSASIPPDINAVLHANLSTLYIEDDQTPETGKEK